MDWKKHGVDSRKRRLAETVHVKLEYGEKTWTGDQAVRDIFQNHLDAEADRMVQAMMERVLQNQPAVLERWRNGTMGEAEETALYQLGGRLYYYKKYVGQVVSESSQECLRSWVQDALNTMASHFNWSTQSASELIRRLEDIHEVKPQLSFQVKQPINQPANPTEPNPARPPTWIDATTVRQASGADINQADIVAIKITDQGTGFDPQLATLFRPSKGNKIYQRGKFGEGLKMSYLHLLRNNVEIKLRSAYRTHSTATEPGQQHLWQGRPIIQPDGSIALIGVEIEAPHTTAATGSSTIIRLPAQIEAPRTAMATDSNTIIPLQTSTLDDLRYLLDPRDGLSKEFLDFDAATDRRYVFFNHGSNVTGVGIQPSGARQKQYVRGIAITEQASGTVASSLLFSYDFLNSDVLAGRDRSHFDDQRITSLIKEVWLNMEDPSLLASCLQRCFLEASKPSGPEASAMQDLAASELPKQRQLFASALQAGLNLQLGFNMLVPDYLTDPYTAELIAKAKLGSIKVIRYQSRVLDLEKFIDCVNVYSPCKLMLLRDLKYQPGQYGLELGQKDAKERRLAERIFTRAKRDLIKLCTDLDGIPIDLDNMTCAIITKRTDFNRDELVEIDFDHQTNRWVYSLRPESMQKIAPLDSTYWQRYLQILMIGQLDLRRRGNGRHEIMQHAQAKIQGYLNQALADSGTDNLVPQTFHLPTASEQRTSPSAYTERQEQRAKLLANWEQLRQAQSTMASVERLVALAKAIPTMHPLYAAKAIRLLSLKVVMRGDTITCFQTQSRPFTAKPMTKKLVQVFDDEMSRKYNRNVYKIDQRYVVPINFNEGAAMVDDKTETVKVVRLNGEIYFVQDGQVMPAHLQPAADGYSINDSCIATMDGWTGGLEKLLLNTHIVEATPQVEPMTLTEGVIPSPLTTEYGKDAWNNPRRVLLDLVQNHLDAADSRGIEIDCEIDEAGTRRRIPYQQVQEGHTIVGITIRDYGPGYAPNHLGQLGASRKHNPLSVGKYGEAQKLLAAMAHRQGLELSFSSVASYQNQSRRWVATAKGEPLTVVINGKRVPDQRIVFQLTSTAHIGEVVSESTLRLPPGTHKTSFWADMVEQIQIDGLDSIIRQLRPAEENDNVIDLGVMHILLDEPGAIYEGGLWVANLPTAVCGYDLPMITSTRERNHIDLERLQRYIHYAHSQCPDPRYADRSVKNIPAGLKIRYAPILETQVDHPDQYDSLPLWDEAVAKYLPMKILHSKQAIVDQLQHARTDEAQLYRAALFYIDHIPAQERLDVDADSFNRYRGLIPTSLDFAERLSRLSLTVPPALLEQLAGIVASCARWQAAMVPKFRGRSSRDAFLHHVQDTDARSLPVKGIDWSQAGIMARDAVYVAPAAVGYHGLIDYANPNAKIGLNEQLLRNHDPGKLLGTIHHELAHYITGTIDYKPNFLVYLLQLVFEAQQQRRK